MSWYSINSVVDALRRGLAEPSAQASSQQHVRLVSCVVMACTSIPKQLREGPHVGGHGPAREPQGVCSFRRAPVPSPRLPSLPPAQSATTQPLSLRTHSGTVPNYCQAPVKYLAWSRPCLFRWNIATDTLLRCSTQMVTSMVALAASASLAAPASRSSRA